MYKNTLSQRTELNLVKQLKDKNYYEPKTILIYDDMSIVC